jgi:predicted ATPase
MATLIYKLRSKGFYILDEPEAALSPTRQMAAMSAIHHLVECESQFIIATHSQVLPAYPRSRILLLDKSGIAEVDYEDTEHYSIREQFLNNHQKMIDTSQGI